jgi:hypothetical protein
MANAPSFDLTAAHRYFSTDCFNKTWDYMEKTARTALDVMAILPFLVDLPIRWLSPNLFFWASCLLHKPDPFGLGERSMS